MSDLMQVIQVNRVIQVIRAISQQGQLVNQSTGQSGIQFTWARNVNYYGVTSSFLYKNNNFNAVKNTLSSSNGPIH